MKKTTILIMLLLLTGCSIEYNVDINDDIVEETITGYVIDKEIGDGSKGTGLNIYYDLLYEEQRALIFGDDLYNKNIIEENNKVKYNFSYTYDGNYKQSRILNNCYENVYFDEDEDNYYISLSGNFECMYSDKIDIVVTSENAIIDSNAKKIKGNKYIWTIKDKEDSNINVMISKNIKYTGASKKDNLGLSTFRIIGLCILVVLIVIVYFMCRKINSDGI